MEKFSNIQSMLTIKKCAIKIGNNNEKKPKTRTKRVALDIMYYIHDTYCFISFITGIYLQRYFEQDALLYVYQ